MGSLGYKQLDWLHFKQVPHLRIDLPPLPLPKSISQLFMFNKRQHRQHGKSAAHPPCRLGAGAHTKPIYLLPPSHRHHRFKGKALQRAPVLTGQPDPLLPQSQQVGEQPQEQMPRLNSVSSPLSASRHCCFST